MIRFAVVDNEEFGRGKKSKPPESQRNEINGSFQSFLEREEMGTSLQHCLPLGTRLSGTQAVYVSTPVSPLIICYSSGFKG